MSSHDQHKGSGTSRKDMYKEKDIRKETTAEERES